MILSGWGNYPRAEVSLGRAGTRAEAVAAVAAQPSLIARGNGRAYGDAALNTTATLSMLPCDRLIAFDADSGLVTCEAGLLLSDLLDLFVPRGWFPPVTPGTRFVTIGGMVAADVHGKNHHGAGSFGAHVEAIELVVADGRVLRCSHQENATLFDATIGGMGLTGVILTVCFRLIRIETAYIRQRTERAADLAQAMALFDAHPEATYSVAWIDCLSQGDALGRSLVYFGEPARIQDLAAKERAAPLACPAGGALTVPVEPPTVLLNRWSVTAFNALYYSRAKEGEALIDYRRYFYPLDNLRAWNRLYGKRGFLQYQCVLPRAASPAGMTALLQRISRSGLGSFLAVLKAMGPAAPLGMLSFPQEGFTLALDFPAHRRSFALLAELDAITRDHGGRIYLAKDSRGLPDLLNNYPRLADFRAQKRAIDPQGKFSSLLSQRLGL